MANTEILREALAGATKFPDNHKQSQWADAAGLRKFDVRASNGEHPECGTTLCLAGWITFQQAPARSMIDPLHSQIILPDGGIEHISEYAAKVADLTDAQVHALFYRAETREQLADMIEHLTINPSADGIDLRDAADMPIEFDDDDYAEFEDDEDDE
jgi:hypothetical protein